MEIYPSKAPKKLYTGSMISNQLQLDSPQSIVDEFANFFKSVYVASSNTSRYSSNETSNSQNISITNVSQLEVSKALKKLKNTKTAGPDKILS